MNLVDPRDMTSVVVDVAALKSVLRSAEAWVDEYCAERASAGEDADINAIRALVKRLER